MKKYILLIVYCLILSLSYAQNLVSNPGFENVTAGFGCPDADGSGPTGDSYSHLIDYWNNIPPWTVPNYKDICVGLLQHQVGSPDLGCPGGHNSSHFVRCFYQEYILQPLSSPLTAGKLYYAEFYAQISGNARSDAGLRFFENRPRQCENHPITDDGPPQVPIPYGTDLHQWTKVSGYFTPGNTINWIGLGNFNTAGSVSGQDYFFDDITIIEVGSSFCPSVNYIQNSYFQDIGKITYRSQDLTIGGKNIASTIPVGNVVIDSRAIVEFKSATRVILEDGFYVNEGANFEAHIAPCDADCFPPIANAGADGISCNGQTILLGSSSEFATSYSWSANPASALAYLSDPNSSSPLFTPPATGYGTIIYTLKVTNSCGQSTTDNVIVNYETNPNNSPTVNLSNINYSDFIQFDINMGAQTGSIIVEVWSQSGSLVRTYTYAAGIDFNCCSYHWIIPESLTPCQDYQIKVYTKNRCFSTLSPLFIINWARNRTPAFTQVSNTFTPDGDGINDSWCFNFTGAVQYNVLIKNPSGVSVYSNSGSILPTSACVWNGACNQSACSQSTVPNGTYFYILTITGCSGNSITNNGFISLFRNRSSLPQGITITADSVKKINSGLTTTSYEENEMKKPFEINGSSFLITPNPNNGSFQITTTRNDKAIAIKEIKVFDIMGQVIWVNDASPNNTININISEHASGIYYVRVVNESGEIEMKKLIKD